MFTRTVIDEAVRIAMKSPMRSKFGAVLVNNRTGKIISKGHNDYVGVRSSIKNQRVLRVT